MNERHLKETVLKSIITWPTWGKQNVQAKGVCFNFIVSKFNFWGGRCLLTLPTLYRVRAYSRRALMNGWALYRVNSYTVVGEKKGKWPFFTWSGSQKIRFWMRSVEDSYNVLSCCIARYRQTDNLCQGAEHHKHENLVSILSPEIFLAGTDPGGMDWVASQPPLE